MFSNAVSVDMTQKEEVAVQEPQLACRREELGWAKSGDNQGNTVYEYHCVEQGYYLRSFSSFENNETLIHGITAAINSNNDIPDTPFVDIVFNAGERSEIYPSYEAYKSAGSKPEQEPLHTPITGWTRYNYNGEQVYAYSFDAEQGAVVLRTEKVFEGTSRENQAFRDHVATANTASDRPQLKQYQNLVWYGDLGRVETEQFLYKTRAEAYFESSPDKVVLGVLGSGGNFLYFDGAGRAIPSEEWVLEKSTIERWKSEYPNNWLSKMPMSLPNSKTTPVNTFTTCEQWANNSRTI